MLLPKTYEYALRCMAQMALLPWETTATAAELSELTNVPKGYTSKILLQLSKSGLLIGEKGHGGGFKLALPPSSVSFLQILTAVGLSFERDRCIAGWGKCNSKDPCPLHDEFSRLNTLFFEWASKTNLADLKVRQNPLRSISLRKKSSFAKDPRE